jgi:hypothetical protein
MSRFVILSALLWLMVSAQAQASDSKILAQEILDRGSALFDTRDTAAMAATYAMDARVFLVERDGDSGQLRVSVKEGRDQIETLYRDLFREAKEKTTSRNTVLCARFVAPDILLIEGDFELNIAEGKRCAFAQERVKQGDKWLIKSLRIYVVSKD